MSFRTDLKKLVLAKWTVAVVILVLLAGGSVYLFHYTQAVIPIMGEVLEDPQSGALYWGYLPPGTFFPFPPVRESLYLRFPLLNPMNDIDQFIYRSLLKTGLIFNVTLIWWIVTLCYSLLFGMLVITKGLKTLQKIRLVNEDKKIN